MASRLSPAVGRATATSFGASLGLVYNVREDGAVNDGVTDNAAAFALTYAKAAAGGGIMYLPPGDWACSVFPVLAVSNVRVEGACMGLTRLLVSAGSTIPLTGVIGVANPATQVHNDVRELTVDANGQGGAVFATPAGVGFILGYINVGSRSTVERVELVNRGPSAGATGILAQGHDVTIQNCWVHDDWWTQSTVTSGAAAFGAVTVTPASVTNFTAGCPALFDPSVVAYGDVSGATGSKVVTPHPFQGKENPWPNGGVTTGMLGIRANSQPLTIGGGVASISVANAGTGYTSQPVVSLAAPPAGGRQALANCFLNGTTIGGFQILDPGAGYTSAPAVTLTGGGGASAAGTAVLTSVAETVNTTATTNSTFTVTTTVTHGTQEPIYYAGSPEVALIKTVGGSTFTITTQLNHANGVAVLTQPLLYDGIAFDSANLLVQRGRGAKAIGNRCERLSLDGVGCGTFDDVEFLGNTIIQCFSGMTATNCTGLVVNENTVDLTYAGVMPATAQWSCFFELNIGNPAASFQLWSASVHTGNIFRGGSFGIYYYSPFLVKVVGAQFCGNVCDSQGQHALVATNVVALSITGNIFRNPNGQGLATSALGLGGPCSAIFLYGTAATQVIDSVQITGNTIIDDRASPLLVTALYATGANVTNVQFDHNSVKGNTGVGVQMAANAAAAGAIKYRDNPGVNPIKAVDTTVLANCSPVMPTNGTPATGTTTYTNVSGVDILLCVKTAGTTTVVVMDGVTLGATFPVGAQLRWPAGSTLAITNSVAPVFAPYGL